MEKVFYVSKNAEGIKNDNEIFAPTFNRFQRVDKLNDLLNRGWSIKKFVTENDEAFFVLEKD